MNPIDKVLYTARVHTTSGGRDGESRSDDGRLNLKLSSPGSAGQGTNPEQIFAAGWSACFTSALWIVAKQMKVTLPMEMSVDTEVDLGLANGAYQLRARMTVHLPGLDAEAAEKLIEAGHRTCPYSRAIRNNVDVETTVDTAGALPSSRIASFREDEASMRH